MSLSKEPHISNHQPNKSLVHSIQPFQMSVMPFRPNKYRYVLDARYWSSKRLEKFVIMKDMRGIAYRLRAIKLDGKGFLHMTSRTKIDLHCDLTQWKQLSALADTCNKHTAACIIQRAIRSHQRGPAEKRYKYCSNIVKEIISTEQTYVQQLDVVVDLIMKPLHEQNKIKEIITEEQFRSIFNGLANIQATNHALLENLTTACAIFSADTRIGDIFLKFTPYLKMYSDYCKMYNTVSDIVCITLKAPHPFAQFVADQMTHAPTELRKHSLTSLLITPVQRLPRYRLLLQDLIKHYSRDSVDYPSLLQAQIEVNKVANFVNEMSKQQESADTAVYLTSITKGLPEGLDICGPGRIFIDRSPALLTETIVHTQTILVVEEDSESDEPGATHTVEKEVDFPESFKSDVTVVLFNDVLLFLTADLGASIVNTGLKFLSVVGITQSKNYEGFNYLSHFKLNDLSVVRQKDSLALDVLIKNDNRKTLKFASSKERDEWFELATDAIEKHKIIVRSLEIRKSGGFPSSQI
ncbi:Guanine nucleotide exchange factor [Entamoeba marina]